MKILYDGRLLHSQPSGVRDVAVGIANGLRTLHERGEIQLVVATTAPVADFPSILLRSRGYMHLGLPLAARKQGCDLILIPRQTRPLAPVRSRAVIHDIGFFRRPDLYSSGTAMKLTTRLVLRSSEVLTVSRFSTQEIVAYGYQGRSIPLPIGAERALSWRPNSESPYLLTVGVRSPHKNLVALVAAWEGADTQGADLVICAKEGTDGGELERRVQSSVKRSSIRLVSNLPGPEYTALVQGASAYVQPSEYEGLCVPLLNALAAGMPSIGSRSGNVGVVLGESNLPQTFDPRDTGDMALAIERVLHDEEFRSAASSWASANVSVTDWADVARVAIGGAACD